ncbi:hypothetical protein [Marinobacterium lutimaris]|uniref:Uncharacterized protein n=1 Tax=Marinobacterium lutimaris TaxID=568106 RepID=A0A1H5XMF1_9GAMM|nr:hypothetical protein [Marinobacterium lutimaris]SEG12939.1 hypothetical protein SAMN05444390_1011438 [Marinobacterium lutimaris]
MREIGIDPDLVKCGVAVTENGKVLELLALHYHDLQAFITEHSDPEQYKYVLENVEVDGTYYEKPGRDRGSRGKRDKVNQNVGQVKAVGRFIGDWLERQGANYEMVTPLQGTAKKAKKDAVFFRQVTGWYGKSNQDTRDAAMLALFGTRQRRLGDAAAR